MNENLKKFLEEASKNEELKARLAALNDRETAAEKVIEIAKEYGFTLTAEDLRPADGEELSLDQLDQVAGGGWFSDFLGITGDGIGTVLDWINPFSDHIDSAEKR